MSKLAELLVLSYPNQSWSCKSNDCKKEDDKTPNQNQTKSADGQGKGGKQMIEEIKDELQIDEEVKKE